MKVSVLMSTYNGEKYIIDQLNSICEQSRQADEVVICDDCSTDRTVNIVTEYIYKKKLSSWKFYKSNENQGWKKNFIEGIKKTSGDIIFFSDQDDIWFQDKIAIVEEEFKNDSNISVVATGETLWNGKDIEINRSTIKGKCYPKFYNRDNNYLIHCSGCTMGIRRNYYEKIIPYYCDGWAHDDFFWKMGIIDDSLLLLNGSTILHRIHNNNESRKKRDRDSTIIGLDQSIFICNHMLGYLKSGMVLNDSVEKNIKVVNREKEANILRLKLIKEKKYYEAVVLLFYLRTYRRKRQLIGDILLAADLKIH